MNQNKIKILDGAVGSLLQIRFPDKYDKNKWMNKIITDNPNELYKIHEEYILQGADIITTFTFRTNPIIYDTLEESNNIVQIAVNQAIKLKQKYPNIQIYGSNSPSEDCYSKIRTLNKEQLYYNHRNHIQFLINSNVDVILNETMSHLDEIIIVCQICQEFNIPYIISLYFNQDLQLLSGENIDLVYQILFKQYQFKPLCLSFNCIQSNDLLNLINNSKQIFKQNNEQQENKMKYGFYINCGSDDYSNNDLNYSVSPIQLCQFYDKILNLNIISKDDIYFLGSCCLSTPSHTNQLAKMFK